MVKEPNGDGSKLPAAFRPLLDFYAAAALAAPVFEEMQGADLPQSARNLLVHEGDMTPALEAYYKEPIYLQVLASRRERNTYQRQVILRLEGSRRAVEFGAITIHLERFSPAPQKEILQARRPLGSILQKHAVPHFSRPQIFFCLKSDSSINSALELQESITLYGRGNTLLAPSGETLAEIVEILAPA